MEGVVNKMKLIENVMTYLVSVNLATCFVD